MTLHAALRCDRFADTPAPRRVARHAFRHGRRGVRFPALASTAQAELVGFEVLDVRARRWKAATFGDVGMVEKITGRATIALDPADPRNAVIADIDLAPKNARGLVLAVADVEILRPLEGGNGTILLEVPNRGRKLMSILFDETADATAASQPGAGIGCRQRLPPVAGLHPGLGRLAGRPAGQAAAAAHRRAGDRRHHRPVARGVRVRQLDNPVTMPLTYPAAAVPGDAELTVRAGPEDKREQPAGPLVPLPRSATGRDHPAGRLRCRRHLRADLHGEGPAGARHGLRRGARCGRLPARRDRGQSARRAGYPCLCAWRLAKRPFPSRLPLSGASTRTSRAASCSTRSTRTSPARGAPTPTSASPRPAATRPRRPTGSTRPTSSPSPTR